LKRTYSTLRSLVQKRTLAGPSRSVNCTSVSRLLLILVETALASNATGAPRSYSKTPLIDRLAPAGSNATPA